MYIRTVITIFGPIVVGSIILNWTKRGTIGYRSEKKLIHVLQNVNIVQFFFQHSVLYTVHTKVPKKKYCDTENKIEIQ